MSQPKSNEEIASDLTEEFMWTEEWDGTQAEVEELIVKALNRKDAEVQKVRDEVIVAIFSGETIEYKGRFFKLSSHDALNFIHWNHSKLDQDKK